MNVEKLTEILSSLKDRSANIVLDVSRFNDDICFNAIYDLTMLSIENKNDTTSIKLSFEKRENKNKKTESRMKSMNIDFLKNGGEND